MIAIKHAKTGEVQFVESLGGYGPEWAQIGPALPSAGDPNLLVLVSGAWVEDPAKIEPILLASIKGEAERRKMGFLSVGGAKKTEYADQAAEVRFFWTLGGTVQAIAGVIGLWTPERRAIVFPCAAENAAKFGDTIDKAIARFSAGMAQSAPRNAIAAAEAKTCAAIKAAATAAGKRTAAAAVIWPA